MKTPFSEEQFFQVFEHYNLAVFPAQIIIFLLGLAGLIFVFSKATAKNKLIGSFLGFLWIWIGLVYHITFFYGINQAALVFAGIFILQGLLIFYYSSRNRLEFLHKPLTKNYFGYFFIFFGLIIYPIIGYYTEGALLRTISLGLPCPSTILTLGFFMLTNSKFPGYLLIIPTLWAIVGLSAAINFGVYQDFMILIAAISAIFFISMNKKKIAGNI